MTAFFVHNNLEYHCLKYDEQECLKGFGSEQYMKKVPLFGTTNASPPNIIIREFVADRLSALSPSLLNSPTELVKHLEARGFSQSELIYRTDMLQQILEGKRNTDSPKGKEIIICLKKK